MLVPPIISLDDRQAKLLRFLNDIQLVKTKMGCSYVDALRLLLGFELYTVEMQPPTLVVPSPPQEP